MLSIDLSPLNAENIRYLKMLYCLYKRDIPKNIEDAYQNVSSNSNTISHSEGKCFQILQRIFPDAQQGLFLDGYELDILFKLNGQKINIEIDGPHHENQRHYDKVRDQYLSKKRNITVCRYELPDFPEGVDIWRELQENFANWLEKNFE